MSNPNKPVEDPAFAGVGKTNELVVWRVENFKLVRLNKTEHGHFYGGDSYLVLKTTAEDRTSLQWNIHYWIGNETTIDESATVAIKAVELDDYLGGAPVQYRELQGHETELFVSYFGFGHLTYHAGGIKTGLKDVTLRKTEKGLYIVKGKKKIRVSQVPMQTSSMNRSDVFILVDAGDYPDIFLFYPEDSNNQERINAQYYARNIRDNEHGGRGKLIVIDHEWENNQRFWSLIGGTYDEVKQTSEMSDEKFENLYSSPEINLYRVSDAANNSVMTTFVSAAPLQQTQLDSKDCFIVDCKSLGIYCWIGKRCTKAEKVKCQQSALDFIQKNNYPKYTQVMTVIDGGETVAFKSIFSSWKD